MKTPTLPNLSERGAIENIIRSALNEMLNIKEKYSVHSLSYPGWPTADFISGLSSDICQKIDDVGQKLGQEHSKNFKYDKTKLPPEIIDEIWL